MFYNAIDVTLLSWCHAQTVASHFTLYSFDTSQASNCHRSAPHTAKRAYSTHSQCTCRNVWYVKLQTYGECEWWTVRMKFLSTPHTILHTLYSVYVVRARIVLIWNCGVGNNLINNLNSHRITPFNFSVWFLPFHYSFIHSFISKREEFPRVTCISTYVRFMTVHRSVRVMQSDIEICRKDIVSY